MTQGRKPTLDSLLGEARVQAFALEGELAHHDAWETAALETLDQLVASGDTYGARRLVAMMGERAQRARALHAEIAEPFRSRMRVAG